MGVITKENYNKLLGASKLEKLSIKKIQAVLECSNYIARIYKIVMDEGESLESIFGDTDIVSQNIKLAKTKQRYADVNRIERKSFRDYAKMDNSLQALNEAVLEKFDSIEWAMPFKTSPVPIIKGDQAIIQLTDTHFNELVDLSDNTYDFEIAGKRMALYAQEVKRFLGSYGVEKVVLAMTGDMINSDRRLDEKLNMSTNRMTAAMLGTNLIQYFIQDLMQQFKQMDVVYVTGNESRAFEFGFTDMVVTDNYDSVIFNMLKLIFKEVGNVNFIDSNPVETVIKVNGKNVLLLHGTTLGANSAQGNVQKYYGKYSNKGTPIHYSLFGHIHFCNIGDTFARSGSLVGSNTYSEFALGLSTKASQSVHLFRLDGTINNLRVELQNTDDIKGYPIQKDLDAYNAKSASKAYRQYKVIEIEQQHIY